MDQHNHEKERFLLKLYSFYLPTLLIAGLIFIINIGITHGARAEVADIPHEDLLVTLVGYAALACEIAAALVIITGVVQSLVSYVQELLDKSLIKQIKSTERIRLRFGHKLSLSLEFAMASDILRLAVSPTFTEIIILCAIVLLRVLLNFFLEHDIEVIREYNILPELREDAEE